MGRDLAAAGYTWSDVCGRLPFDQFIAFVVYSPPGSAVFHLVNDGWDANTHKVTDLIQWVKVLISMNTAKPEDTFEKLGTEPRPGHVKEEKPPAMTIGGYMKLAGLEGGD